MRHIVGIVLLCSAVAHSLPTGYWLGLLELGTPENTVLNNPHGIRNTKKAILVEKGRPRMGKRDPGSSDPDYGHIRFNTMMPKRFEPRLFKKGGVKVLNEGRTRILKRSLFPANLDFYDYMDYQE